MRHQILITIFLATMLITTTVIADWRGIMKDVKNTIQKTQGVLNKEQPANEQQTSPEQKNDPVSKKDTAGDNTSATSTPNTTSTLEHESTNKPGDASGIHSETKDIMANFMKRCTKEKSYSECECSLRAYSTRIRVVRKNQMKGLERSVKARRKGILASLASDTAKNDFDTIGKLSDSLYKHQKLATKLALMDNNQEEYKKVNAQIKEMNKQKNELVKSIHLKNSSMRRGLPGYFNSVINLREIKADTAADDGILYPEVIRDIEMYSYTGDALGLSSSKTTRLTQILREGRKAKCFE